MIVVKVQAMGQELMICVTLQDSLPTADNYCRPAAEPPNS